MQGEPRPGAKSVWLTINGKLLAELDALLPPRSRSKVIEGWAREFVLRHRYAGEVPPEIRELLALID